MSWNEPGPRYYYNDPSGTPYHDPAWYRGRKDDDDDDKYAPLTSTPEVFIKLTPSEVNLQFNI